MLTVSFVEERMKIFVKHFAVKLERGLVRYNNRVTGWNLV
jgi:hypothetical protein